MTSKDFSLRLAQIAMHSRVNSLITLGVGRAGLESCALKRENFYWEPIRGLHQG
jgi:hypothetical protein